MANVSDKGVNTLPIPEVQIQMGAKEAVREALLQASEAKSRAAALDRAKNEVSERLKSTERELEHYKDFLKVGLPKTWLRIPHMHQNFLMERNRVLNNKDELGLVQSANDGQCRYPKNCCV